MELLKNVITARNVRNGRRDMLPNYALEIDQHMLREPRCLLFRERYRRERVT